MSRERELRVQSHGHGAPTGMFLTLTVMGPVEAAPEYRVIVDANNLTVEIENELSEYERSTQRQPCLVSLREGQAGSQLALPRAPPISWSPGCGP